MAGVTGCPGSMSLRPPERISHMVYHKPQVTRLPAGTDKMSGRGKRKRRAGGRLSGSVARGVPEARERKPLKPPVKPDSVSWHLGIDPGVTGAWSVVQLCHDTNTWSLVHCQDLPVKATQRNNKQVRFIDALALAEQVAPWADSVDSVTVEQVFAPPGIMSTVAFSLGRTAGLIDVALDLLPALTGKRRDVPPRSWKTPLGLDSDKERTRQAAIKFFGADTGGAWWPNKSHHNRAESALLSVWSALNPAHMPVTRTVKASEKPAGKRNRAGIGEHT